MLKKLFDPNKIPKNAAYGRQLATKCNKKLYQTDTFRPVVDCPTRENAEKRGQQ